MYLSAAGMPSPLIWRKSSSEIEEVSIHGLPLGTFSGFTYESTTIELHLGDTLIFMSDGLPELFDPESNQMGNDRVQKCFVSVADKSPGDIISHLISKAREWCQCEVPDDDLTLLVIKMKDDI